MSKEFNVANLSLRKLKFRIILFSQVNLVHEKNPLYGNMLFITVYWNSAMHSNVIRELHNNPLITNYKINIYTIL